MKKQKIETKVPNKLVEENIFETRDSHEIIKSA